MKICLFSLLFLVSFAGIAQRPDTSLNHPHKWWITPAVGVGYAGLTLLCYRHADSHVQEESQEGKTPFKTAALTGIGQFGLGKVNGMAAGATTLVSLITKDRKLQATSIVWIGSLLLNSTVTNTLKVTVQRHRPYSGSPYNTFDGRKGPRVNTSFPSAHTSNAFTTATVFATMYKDHKWVPWVAYSVASLVGISRIYNNAHWASDVMTGAAIGVLSAKAMAATYKWAGKRLTFLPQAGRHYTGVTALVQL